MFLVFLCVFVCLKGFKIVSVLSGPPSGAEGGADAATSWMPTAVKTTRRRRRGGSEYLLSRPGGNRTCFHVTSEGYRPVSRSSIPLGFFLFLKLTFF